MKNIIKRIAAMLTSLIMVGAIATSTIAIQASAENGASTQQGQPPEKPDGDNNGVPPDGPGGGGAGGPGGGSSAVTEWTAVTEYSEDTETNGQKYISTGADENAVLVSSGNVRLTNPTITRTSSSSTGGDNASFYGVGAAVLATSGTLIADGGTVTTDAKGGAGYFAYDDATIYVQNAKINTTQDASGGIHAAGSGTLYAWDLDVTTAGGSSAAIRSDRGGGTMVVDGGSYTTSGTGSPAIYCTADIAVNNAQLTANNSEGVCIEGLNSLHIFDSDLKSTMPTTEQNENLVWSVIVYQSMSGDAEEGNSDFYMDGGSISGNGDIIYTTNTESHITLKNVDITSTASDYAVLRATGNANGRGWGSTGSNGADCTFTAIQQKLDGNVIYDSISDLEFYLTDSSTLTGAMIDDETDAGDGGDAQANVYIDSTSTWVVTKDSTCTNLYNAGTIKDTDGKTVTVKDSSGNVLVKGESDITITVTGTYSENVDLSGATAAVTFADYSVEKPEQFGASTQEESATDVSSEDETSETVSEQENSEESSEKADDNKDSSATGWVVGGGIAVAAVLAGAATAIVKKKKK